jgi:hypothetical protein
MATLNQVEAAVMAFAKSTSFFITPGSVDDPLQPKPTAMTTEQFSEFYFDLLEALAKASIKVQLPFEALKQARTWWNVCVLVNHSQI